MSQPRAAAAGVSRDGREEALGRDRAVVLGLGNILHRDEGLGVFCLEPLRERLRGSPAVELVDGGVLGLRLLPVVESCRDLLILDAIDAGRPPGTIVEIEGPDLRLFSRLRLSWHQMGFQEVLQLARVRDRFPLRLIVIGAQPADLSPGVGLTVAIAAIVPEIVERAVARLSAWGRPAR